MTLNHITPVFRIFDEARAKAFYIDYLGFEVAFEHRRSDDAPLYVGLFKDGCHLHLSEHHGDGCPGAHIRIAINGLEAYHRALGNKNYAYSNPSVQTMPWGSNEMSLNDPFGNRLTFVEPQSPQ